MSCGMLQAPDGKFIYDADDVPGLPEPIHKLPVEMFAMNRQKLVSAMRAAGHTSGIVLLKGGSDETLYSTDANNRPFRQEPYFFWAFGCQEPDCLGAIDIATGKATLFIPRLPDRYTIVLGQIYPPEWHVRKYAVDACAYDDEVNEFLKAAGGVVFLNVGVNTDSDKTTPHPSLNAGDIAPATVDTTTLHDIIAEARVLKSSHEMDVLRFAGRVGARAHIRVMQAYGAAAAAKRALPAEYQAEALYRFHALHDGGAKHVSYTCICASGVDNATLHYPYNNKAVPDGAFLLYDMGAEYCCYISDITCSFPANGVFSDAQKEIYAVVLECNRAVARAAKPGVNWVDLHRLSYEVMLRGLARLGVVKLSEGVDPSDDAAVAADVAKMIADGVGALFQPHGLGHLIGCEVHDVGGYLPHCPPRPEAEGFSRLRFARDLEVGMAFTIEPGLYIHPIVLEKIFSDDSNGLRKWLNEDLIKARYWAIGGVRIEDDVLLTNEGLEVYTNVPREVADIEAVMAGAEWDVAKPIFYHH